VCAANLNHIVIPIEKGRALKTQRAQESQPDSSAPTIRRLIQCIDLLKELSIDIERKTRGDQK
jgi:hypothetical protein